MEYKIDKKWKITNGRTTEEGIWKITCKQRLIKDEETKECIGKKRILTFYRGSGASKEKTNWVMHQYYIFPDHPLPNQKIYVLCYVKKQQDNKANSPDRGEGKPSSTATSEIENHVPRAATPVAHGHEEEHWESYTGGGTPSISSWRNPLANEPYRGISEGGSVIIFLRYLVSVNWCLVRGIWC